MKAPDKIYVQIDKPTGAMFVNYDRNDQDNIEYIRKEALLEWLDGKLTIEGATEGIVGGYDLALKDVIKHIKSL